MVRLRSFVLQHPFKFVNFMKLLLMGLVLGTLVVIFFYHLNFTALMSYDEAWYADVTRNLVRTGNPLHLVFNGDTFTDHPPFGFIMMAVPTLILGSNELSARFIPALLGVGCIILIFLVGRALRGKLVGVCAAGILLSSLWFMLRARSGNLDIPFLFWSLFTCYWLVETKKNVSRLYLATLGFCALFLTKTLIGIGILPLFLYTLLQVRKQLRLKQIVVMILMGLTLILPWYVYNQLINHSFLYHHFIQIGSRGGSNTFGLASLSKSFYFLQVGMGKWFKLFMLSLPLAGILFVWKRNARYGLVSVSLYLAGFMLPLLFSSDVEVWHFIPSYAPIALLIAIICTDVWSLFPPLKKNRWIILLVFLGIAGYQFRQSTNLLYVKRPQSSSEKEISLRAGAYPEVYFDEVFHPAAVYYSRTKVHYMLTDVNAYQNIVSILAQKKAVAIVNKTFIERLSREHRPFEVITSSSDHYLIK